MGDALFLVVPPPATAAHEALLALVREGVMPDSRRVQALGMQATPMLQAGRVSMLVEAVPPPRLMETLTVGWGVAPLPRFGDQPPRYFRSASGGLSIAAGTRDPGAAWRVAAWLVGTAAHYQPHPVLADVDFAAGWERRNPAAAGSGFREVWERSERAAGGDPRYFVRFSA